MIQCTSTSSVLPRAAGTASEQQQQQHDAPCRNKRSSQCISNDNMVTANVSSKLLVALMEMSNQGVTSMKEGSYIKAIKQFSATLTSARSANRIIKGASPASTVKINNGTATVTVTSATASATSSSTQQQQEQQQPQQPQQPPTKKTKLTATTTRRLQFNACRVGNMVSSFGFLYQQARIVSHDGTLNFASTVFQSLCSATIYNLALAHHLQGLLLASNSFLIRALRLYEQAYILFAPDEDATRAMGILSNVGMLYSELNERDQADACWMKLLDVILKFSDNAGEDLDGFFTNVSHLLSLQSKTAAAA